MPHDGHDHSKTFVPDEEDSLDDFAIEEMAIRELLIEKGLFTPDEFRRGVEAIDSRTPRKGAEVVARAWTDPDFRERLMTDANSAIAEYGIEMGETVLYAVENTPEVHNVVVCTLCSCYPKPLLGVPPDWYKSRNYRARTVREPREVLKEFGTVIPENVEVRVHDSTADLRYIVIPERPAGTDGMDAAQLADLVGRDAMIGVVRAIEP
jgi:nitrile hydratase